MLQKRSNALLTREKKRSEELLLNILPAEVAEELKDKGYAAARHFDKVTVLFADFVGFTNVASILSAQELIDELNTCFKGFDEITGQHNIEKIKTIGDAYLAVGGLPVESELHAENVVKAAIDIVAFMKKRKSEKGDKTFEVRIGIHSGSVVAGIVGIKKFAYDIWGDTVNVAARMEQNSLPNRINISQSTFDLVKDKFHCTYRGEIEAKNKGKLSMYFIEYS
jgi:class 3 adenylate cyclase